VAAPAKVPTLAGLASAAPKPLPPTKVRMHSGSLDPAPKRLALPSPEELGLGAAAVARSVLAVDWNATHQRLKEMGAVGFHIDHPRAGVTQITFWLPTSEPGRTQLIEATAATEAEAVSLALRQADSFRVASR
jgi:hypothetical protein